jgi:hypothetical protein
MTLAWLALTKVLFGYVILAGSFLSAIALWRRGGGYRRTLIVGATAVLLCTPYLAYTYSRSGRFFYWASSGGLSLYWLSTPFDGELGDWHKWEKLSADSPIRANHERFFASLEGLNEVERDSELKRQALCQIADHPKKFALNWLANVGRLLFSYPFTDTPQKLSTYFYLLPNMFLVVPGVPSLYVAWIRRRDVPHELWMLLGFGILSFLGNSLLSAYARQFTPLVPIFALWVLVVMGRSLRLEPTREPVAAMGHSA